MEGNSRLIAAIPYTERHGSGLWCRAIFELSPSSFRASTEDYMMKQFPKRTIARCSIALSLLAASNVFAQDTLPAYDLLLRGGHVVDAKNHIDSVMDVAIKDGKIAKVSEHIAPAD